MRVPDFDDQHQPCECSQDHEHPTKRQRIAVKHPRHDRNLKRIGVLNQRADADWYATDRGEERERLHRHQHTDSNAADGNSRG